MPFKFRLHVCAKLVNKLLFWMRSKISAIVIICDEFLLVCGFCYILQMTSVMQSIKAKLLHDSKCQKFHVQSQWNEMCAIFCFYKLDSQKSGSEFIIRSRIIRISHLVVLEKRCKFIRFFTITFRHNQNIRDLMIGVCLCCECLFSDFAHTS